MSPEQENLIEDYLNGRLDTSRFKALEQELIHNKRFAIEFAKATRFDSSLSELLQETKGEKRWIKDLQSQEKKSFSSFRVIKVAAQALIAVGLIAALLLNFKTKNPVVIHKLVGAGFGAESASLGPIEYEKSYELKEGLLSLRFNDETEVIVEAPAKFKSNRADHLWLESGKISVDIPSNAKSIVIETKDGMIKEVNTSFAMDVSASESELHVFEGIVHLKQEGEAESFAVNQGQAAILDQQDSRYRPFRNARFVHSKEFHQLSKGWSQTRKEAWLNSMPSNEQNPHLLASYHIEKNMGQFHNNPSVKDSKWVQGRWPGSWALDFSEEKDHVKIEAKGKTDQFTLMAWVRLDHQPQIFNSIYHTHDWERDGQVHWMVIEGEYMLLGIHGNSVLGKESLRKPKWNQSESEKISNPMGRWVHLATTYDKDKKMTRFFIDGEFVNETKFEVAHTAIFDEGQIGNWNLQKFGGSRQLSGRLDEFFIYTTVLKDQQIKTHYSLGNPYNI